MKTFDYEKAWLELAKPAFLKLPNSILNLVEETQLAADNLSQLKNLQMPWPEDGGKLRAAFESHDCETLSHAARVVYFYSHWRPSASIAGDAREIGAGWKFANYCDQILRLRLNIPDRDSSAQVSFQIHEGVIRLCYSSRDSWLWEEVATATENGLQEAGKLATALRIKISTTSKRDERDSKAYSFFEKLKTEKHLKGWDTSGFMIEEAELELRRAARMPKPDKEKLRAEVVADFEKVVKNETVERDGKLWLIDNDLPLENCIYYNHTGNFCFGWRKTITGTARDELLAQLAKFPFPYDVK